MSTLFLSRYALAASYEFILFFSASAYAFAVLEFSLACSPSSLELYASGKIALC